MPHSDDGVTLRNILHPTPDDLVAARIEALPQVERVKFGPPTARCETGEAYVTFEAGTPEQLIEAIASRFAGIRGTLYWRYDPRVQRGGCYTRLVITGRPEILRWDPEREDPHGGLGDFIEIGGANA